MVYSMRLLRLFSDIGVALLVMAFLKLNVNAVVGEMETMTI